MNKTYHLRSLFEMYGSFTEPNNDSSTFTGRLARTKDNIELTSSPMLREIDPNLDFPGANKISSICMASQLKGHALCIICTLHTLQG
jgi:hypothetical protein